MASEGKTLRELNVQPGDVVRRLTAHRAQSFLEGDIYDVVAGGEIVNRNIGSRTTINSADLFRIVSRATPLPHGHVRLSDGTVFDLTSNQKIWEALSPEERAAMKSHGGPYVFWWMEWCELGKNPSFSLGYVYQVRPASIRMEAL